MFNHEPGKCFIQIAWNDEGGRNENLKTIELIGLNGVANFRNTVLNDIVIFEANSINRHVIASGYAIVIGYRNRRAPAAHGLVIVNGVIAARFGEKRWR